MSRGGRVKKDGRHALQIPIFRGYHFYLVLRHGLGLFQEGDVLLCLALREFVLLCFVLVCIA